MMSSSEDPQKRICVNNNNFGFAILAISASSFVEV